jgi:hypothetical protein
LKHTPLPSPAELRRLFTYDPASGLLRWAVRPHARSRKRPGDEAGTLHHSGYIQVRIDGTFYLAHRLIWRWMLDHDPGALEIDHHNRVRSDNRWTNLRVATPSQNRCNRVALNPHRGVHYIARDARYGAQIKADRAHRWLGSYVTPEAACRAYRAAADDMHGGFAGPRGCGCAV